ncbi:MAG: hypothetical protein GX247_01905 [Mollicutes bacterium]|nr:hypothetical protein [Mollicutes bacterium]
MKSWRIEAIEKIKKIGFDGIVYIPEYEGFQGRADYVNQAMWEREALTEATVIMFWIPRKIPNMPAFTTNVEFGYWIHTGKIIYGRPDDAEKIKYLDWLYKLEYGKEPINNLDLLLKESIRLCNELYNQNKYKTDQDKVKNKNYTNKNV